MNAKMLLPVLIALHIAAAALIVDVLGLGVEQQDSVRPIGAWKSAEWNPVIGCMAGNANDKLDRYWSREYRQLNAIGSDRHGCVIVH